jgi:hypothetical protein
VGEQHERMTRESELSEIAAHDIARGVKGKRTWSPGLKSKRLALCSGGAFAT